MLHEFGKQLLASSITAITLSTLGLAPQVQAATPIQASAKNVVKTTLDNGLRVVIVPNKLAPVVTTQVNYLVGSDEAPKGFPGTAHAVEHMMFRGSQGISKDQLAAVAANMGGSFNAMTTQGVTRYYFTTPAQDLDVALHLESLRMRDIDATQAGWKDERGAIEQEVSRDLSSPNFKFYTQLVAHLFKGTPYAHTPLGTRESFNQTSAAMLKAFHDRWYAPNNAILVISGDVDPAKAIASIKKHFGSIPRKQLPARPHFDFQPVKARTIKLPTDSPYGLAFIAYRWPGFHDKDYATAAVLADALASKRADLFGLGMTGKALGAEFASSPLPQSGLAYAVGIFPRGADDAPLLKEMRDILAKAAHQGVDPALVETAKRNAISHLEFSRNSIEGQANLWSNALSMQGLSSPDEMKAQLEAVTPAKVNALARTLLDPAHAVTAVLTPQSSGKPTSSKGFGGKENFSSSPDKPVELPGWAQKAFAQLQIPRSTIKPTSYHLSNGIHLIVQPEHISHTVSLRGNIKSNPDMQTPKGQEGIDQLVDGLFSFGTEKLGRIPFQTALDKISASESAGSSFSVATPTAQFAKGVSLLAQHELHPAMPDQGFAILKQQMASAIDGELQSPSFLTHLGMAKSLLPKDDPALRHPTPQSIASLDLDKAKAYYHQVYRPDMTTIVVVGDITPEHAREVVEREFGHWHANGPRPEVRYPAVPRNKPSQMNVPDSSAVQSSVTLAQNIPLTTNDNDRFALGLGNEVLGGGFYASRLYHDLRDKSGLVYTVGSTIGLDQRRGSYSVYFGSDPDKVSAAARMIRNDLYQMQKAPVTTAELKRAQGILLRQIPLSEASFGGIGSQLLDYAEDGKPLNESHIAAEHYMKLTPADVQAAFKKYIRPNGFVQVSTGPTPK